MIEKSDISASPRLGFSIGNRMSLVVVAHAVLFAFALFSAFELAYNFKRMGGWLTELYLPLLALAMPIKLVVFHYTGQYRGSWRYVGLSDLMGVIRSSLMATFLFLTAYFLLENTWYWAYGVNLIDRSQTNPTLGLEALRQSAVFGLDWAATVGFVCAARVLVRFYHEEIRPERIGDVRRVLIVGHGDTGEALVRELLRMPDAPYHCVGILDDEARLCERVHGVEVIARTEKIREVCERHGVQEVLIALPRATPKMIRSLVERCEGTGVKFRTVPAVSDVISGRVQGSQIREVDIADLLGREPVKLDAARIGEQLRGKRILVTGAGGSIGSEMCRQIATFMPKRLILVEQAENNLFEIERELRDLHPGLDVVPYVADIVDRDRVRAIFRREAPSTVFHAAAHKHVPMMEVNPGEAIKNNIVGTMTVADVSVEFGVDEMVMISTDKAVNPTSIMGCSKRVAEIYVQGLNERGETQFVTVRFGNVLGSSGSVVPIFRRQIAAGGPVTVTHPDMTRYFMTIPEAAQLVLQAGTMGNGGEIYVLHMGDPVKIVDLARDMITLSGLRPGKDIEIEFIGTRPGEKLFEELSNEGEHIGDTAHPKIGIWKHRAEDWPAVCEGIDRLRRMADSADLDKIQRELKRIVPEYQPAETGGVAPKAREYTPHTASQAPASQTQ
ncbi:MAG: polysaccharide biosynthesis protein [Planctomycetes bacterium]|nr:polysaccharide biosynthesis protein [Planctomycetota bacterium]